MDLASLLDNLTRQVPAREVSISAACTKIETHINSLNRRRPVPPSRPSQFTKINLGFPRHGVPSLMAHNSIYWLVLLFFSLVEAGLSYWIRKLLTLVVSIRKPSSISSPLRDSSFRPSSARSPIWASSTKFRPQISPPFRVKSLKPAS